MSESFTSDQLKQIRDHGLSESEVSRQLEIFKQGLKPMHLVRPAVPGDGIHLIADSDRESCRSLFEKARAAGRVSLFVPASGAASRMFKSLLTVYYRDEKQPDKRLSDLNAKDSDDAAVIEFFTRLEEFAFSAQLADFFSKQNRSLSAILSEGDYVPVLYAVLLEPELGWSLLPKGLVPFHQYGNQARTAFQEHLHEAAAYAADEKGKLRIHFTVAENALEKIRQNVEAECAHLKTAGIESAVEYSFQRASTDTVAVDMENRLVEDADGSLTFRPGGHGALLENLNTCGGDLVFIKNIDNILPDSRRTAVVESQQILGGFLASMEEKIHGLLGGLQNGKVSEASVAAAESFIAAEFDTQTQGSTLDERAAFATAFLNRPLRACGMVKNQGEPGGGPFWICNQDGKVSRQIVEKSQVDTDDAEQAGILSRATHFNPVNLVCSLRDYTGRPFDLRKYTDPRTSFISIKSKDGRDLKALELPGLWNGAMAEWLTFFVEVPVETFAPVKELNDLLRPEHQNK